MMVCHGLWDNTQRVVQYNREHLLLNARLTNSDVDFSGEDWTFQFRDEEGRVIAEGQASATRRQPSDAAWKIARQMGLRGFLNRLRAPLFKMPVVNTRRPGDTRNHVCTTYTACEKPLIRDVAHSDFIAVREPVYAALDFKIAFVQELNDIGFIFLRPEPL